MDIFSTLQEDMKTSMKSGNKERLGYVKMMIAEIKNAKINTEGGRDKLWTDQEYCQILSGYHKTLLKTLNEYPAEKREPLEREIAVVEEYLPKRLSAEEVQNLIKTELEQTTERNFGTLMKIISQKIAGRADGRLVSESLKTLIANLK